MQWSVWAVKFVKKMLKTCFKTPAPEPNFSPEMLLELMGDSRPDPEIAVSGKRITQGERYTKGSTCTEDKVELSPLSGGPGTWGILTGLQQILTVSKFKTTAKSR